MGSIYVFLAFLESTMVAHALGKGPRVVHLLDLQQDKFCVYMLINPVMHISTFDVHPLPQTQ